MVLISQERKENVTTMSSSDGQAQLQHSHFKALSFKCGSRYKVRKVATSEYSQGILIFIPFTISLKDRRAIFSANFSNVPGP